MTTWEHLRTDETRRVETLLRKHFQRADAYRYNSASIRVRVIDERFEAMPFEEREDLVMPVLRSLPKRTLADILLLIILAPSELNTVIVRSLTNLEFEEPSFSRL